MELRYYIRMVIRGWWIVFLAFAAAVGVAAALISITLPIYRVDARFLISPDPELIQIDDRVYSLDALNRRSIIATFAEILNSRQILERSRQDLNLTLAEIEQYKVNTVVLPDANVLQIFIEGPNPYTGVQIAESIGKYAIAQVRERYQVYTMSLLDPPVVPLSPERPKPIQDIAVAGLLGVGAGIGLAILRGVMSTSVVAVQQATLIDRESGAWSRRYFRQRLEEEVSRSMGNALSIGLLHLPGLDDLSLIAPPAILQNMLRQVTGILRSEFRGKDLIARWSESGFAVLFPGTSEASAYRTMQIVQLALSRPLEHLVGEEAAHLRPQTTVVTREGNETAAQLLERAEQAYKKL